MTKHKRANGKPKKIPSPIRQGDLQHEAIFFRPTKHAPACGLKPLMKWDPYGDGKGDDCGVYVAKFSKGAFSGGYSVARGKKKLENLTPHSVVWPMKQ